MDRPTVQLTQAFNDRDNDLPIERITHGVANQVPDQWFIEAHNFVDNPAEVLGSE